MDNNDSKVPNIIISTVQRPNKSPYLDKCIESIRQDWNGEIYLMVGGEDTTYTDKYENRYFKHFLWEVEKGLQDNVRRAGYGYYRCLKLGQLLNTPCILVEDDAVFVKDWYKKLKKLLTFVQEKRYIISFISPWKIAVPDPDIKIPSLQPFVYNARLSYGVMGEMPTANTITYSNTTAIYYPTSILKTRIAEFVERFVVRDEGVYDLAVGYWFFRMNIPIYIAVPNLLEHVDTSDSAMGSTIRRFHVNYDDWDYSKW